MKDNRYQFQSRWVKCARWLRYRPLGLIVFGWWIARWAMAGLKPLDFSCEDDKWIMTRGETLEHYWTIRKSMDQFKMGWYYTSEEVFADLRGERKELYPEVVENESKNN